MEKYFCIFGGGGIRGAAYTGVLKALKELDIKITGFAGSSIGSVVAGLYVIGYMEDELQEVFNNINLQFFNDLNFNFGKDFALSKGENFYEWIKNKIEDKFYENKNEERKPVTFKDIDKDFIVYSVDIKNSKFHEFSKEKTPDTEIAYAIRVSVGMPGLYAPVITDNECLVDGDLLKAMPLWAASGAIQGRDEKILEFRLENNENQKNISNTFDYLNAVYDSISGFASDFISKTYGDFEKYDYIKINTDGISVVDFMSDKNKKEKMAQTGYDTTINYFKNKFPKKQANILKIYNCINSSIKKIIYLIENKNYKEARFLISDLISSEILKKRIIKDKIIDKLYECKRIYNENYIVKKTVFGEKATLIDSKIVINKLNELLHLRKEK